MIQLLFKKGGCVLTSKDESGLANLAAARARCGSCALGAETRHLLRTNYTTWTQQWHCIDTQSDSRVDDAITSRLQDGLLEAQLGPREVGESLPQLSLEQYIESLDHIPVDARYEIPPECVNSNGLLRVATAGSKSEFETWSALLESARLFVLDRVAAGSALTPTSILALHLYTVPCTLFYLCNRAMRTYDGSLARAPMVYKTTRKRKILWNSLLPT